MSTNAVMQLPQSGRPTPHPSLVSISVKYYFGIGPEEEQITLDVPLNRFIRFIYQCLIKFSAWLVLVA